MINFQFYPRSHGVTPKIRKIIDCFKTVDRSRDTTVQLKSNEMLELVRPHLEKIGFKAETSKNSGGQIHVPVLFSENDGVDIFLPQMHLVLTIKLLLKLRRDAPRETISS